MCVCISYIRVIDPQALPSYLRSDIEPCMLAPVILALIPTAAKPSLRPDAFNPLNPKP